MRDHRRLLQSLEDRFRLRGSAFDELVFSYVKRANSVGDDTCRRRPVLTLLRQLPDESKTAAWRGSAEISRKIVADFKQIPTRLAENRLADRVTTVYERDCLDFSWQSHRCDVSEVVTRHKGISGFQFPLRGIDNEVSRPIRLSNPKVVPMGCAHTQR